jgi:chaperonin GroEL (HSP60 family)
MIPDLACVEVKDRADDALSATRAAVEAGIGPGGGTALLRAKVAVAQVSTDSRARAPGGAPGRDGPAGGNPPEPPRS